MKLRILDNSIRLRLSRSEVEAFRDTGYCEAQLSFPNKTALRYCLQVKEDQATIRAHFDEGILTVTIPAALGQQWTDSEQIGLSGEPSLEEGETLKILIEKDFKCLHREGVDESDNYPHPKESLSK